MIFETFACLASEKGLSAIQHTPYHWQLRGGSLIVNYYPSTGRIYVDRTDHAKRGTPEQAIEIAVQSSLINPEKIGEPVARSGGSKRKRWKLKQLAADPHCQYCNTVLQSNTATVDHVIPLAAGGKDIPENWVLACHTCNTGKGNVIPGEIGKQLANNYKNRRKSTF
jgi:hypothetical protein